MFITEHKGYTSSAGIVRMIATTGEEAEGRAVLAVGKHFETVELHTAVAGKKRGAGEAGTEMIVAVGFHNRRAVHMMVASVGTDVADTADTETDSPVDHKKAMPFEAHCCLRTGSRVPAC